jgi:hypothetical protein
MTSFKVDEVTKIAKDALYVGVGLGVIGIQKIQVRRNELQKQLKGPVGGAREQVGSLSKAIDDRVKLVEERLQGVEGRVRSMVNGAS